MQLLNAVKRYWAILTGITFAAITALSLWPLPRLPEVPGDDKTLHLIAYAALILPAALRRPRHWLWLGLFFIAYSGIIELIQPYVNRHGEWADMAANTLGLACGLLAGTIMRLCRDCE